MIHSTDNVVAVPIDVHIELHAYYSSVRKFTGGKTVREWLRTKPFNEQYEFGVRKLQEIMEK